MPKPIGPKRLKAKKIHFSFFFQSKAKTIFARPTQSAAPQATASTLNSIQTANCDTSRVKKTSKYVLEYNSNL